MAKRIYQSPMCELRGRYDATLIPPGESSEQIRLHPKYMTEIQDRKRNDGTDSENGVIFCPEGRHKNPNA